jgi:hypothetical protein
VRQQVEDGVRHWLARTLLGRLVTELLKLLTPAGAVLAALEKTYTTVLFFLDKARQFQQLLTTLVNALAPIAAGQVDAAAKVEQVLAGLVPLALGFVADFIGLGGLTGAVREQLTKVRTLVNALLDRLLAKVLHLVGQLAKAGQQAAGKAVDTVKGFFGVRTEFAAGPEHHSLYFAQRNGRSVLIIESTPTEINEFLDHFYQYYPAAGDKQVEIAAIRRHLSTYDPLYQQLAVPGLPEKQAGKHHQALLFKNVTLSGMLKELIGKADHRLTANGKRQDDETGR